MPWYSDKVATVFLIFKVFSLLKVYNYSIFAQIGLNITLEIVIPTTNMWWWLESKNWSRGKILQNITKKSVSNF